MAEFGYFAAGDDAGYEVDAPATNMLTETPGQVAIASTDPSVIRIYIDGAETTGTTSSENIRGRPVDVVAIINTNFIPNGDISISCALNDTSGGISTTDTFYTNGRGDGATITNVIFLASDMTGNADLTDIKYIEISFNPGYALFGRKDAWVNVATEDAPFFGTVVAGPAYSPANGVRLEGYAPGVFDPSQIVQSIGATTWTSRRTKLRRVSGEFALLNESEIEAEPPSCGLRQLAEHCGISRPALWILNESEVGKQTLYAYLVEDLVWTVLDKISDGSPTGLEPGYRAAFNLREAK